MKKSIKCYYVFAMRILGIETSCDETAAAIIEIAEDNSGEQSRTIKVLSNTISSQVKLHAKFGGVVPNLAAREHVKNIGHVFRLALKEAGLSRSGLDNIDLIAVTRGPGLGPALLVGIAFAKALAWKYSKPLIGVNHLEGHILSNFFKKVGAISNFSRFAFANRGSSIAKQSGQFPIFKEEIPILNLIVSGGHTELVLMTNYGKYKLIGETLDDAVGEAFDKVARLLGLGYPGGPAISARAERYKIQDTRYKIQFPRPMLKSKDYNFSYSGLKTAVLYKIRDLEKDGIKLTDAVKNEICYEFQKAAVDVLIHKTVKAAKEYGVRSVFLSGGVSANKLLRSDLNNAIRELGVKYSQPELEYTGDNAAMIALAGYVNWIKKLPPSHSSFVKTSKDKKATAGKWKSVEMDANLGF
ncbi:MAG: tRNA (adenosine(37)-N6)-threonylcarbamoyltransferase complex transferase subunit TsaD [Candidatus Yanofskybacteria bacterium RIFCSPHIGHO2_02_FULL_41_29]|uniref:tRNA N6-adenosine threonylcarbamoyltransferase n=1 Tax=Candidatus Yanofskybacteria bacterium RIFCSPHIGHO2_01_FULL_41_53 TaxID=1802663 RepID=A0A1F8ELL2_9BACT|nr:MAG: tRNA (adenosine(37)-N6)-threonylcarbamoyltransferase complex transferase subunit TsaD [Candidatus Yanofskybacteria bacterium RIFCSPHIGHO2_01_FULL_41_53]OGN11695.1 MAG: tRNA (adenosine(37)-N6)-threonylcarbamoyltransferase complex transferase subunit TsaD [Candidatus Yanofskybacteria bacterium RIFCSPHIGHO2_02_FULL_41_29]OGN19180.1 MAG: tRNA (adenosine(37)-N6)-threonylcarbamoyltransferase complex transferase subunit TsaD [Candidatus Yanofskybacteria bacterium RIFCSPHIGHO2_12_FULL_41_9]OGN24